jgi:hypothetical protein
MSAAKRILRALRFAREEFGQAMYFDDWAERRDIFAAHDLFDDAWNERPKDRDAIETAFDLVTKMMHELNTEKAEVSR